MRPLLLPLLVLSALASYVSGRGLAATWFPDAHWLLVAAATIALHMSWLILATQSRFGAAGMAAWLACLGFARSGAGAFGLASPTFGALMLEGIPLLLAMSSGARSSWPERLARWRRSRAQISAQLRLAHGLIPWLRDSLRQVALGSAAGSDYQLLLAVFAGAEPRLQYHLSRVALPEQLRQAVLTSATTLLSQAETAAMRLSIDLEQQALGAGASCRDLCDNMPNLTPDRREALATECEAIFLDLIRPCVDHAHDSTRGAK